MARRALTVLPGSLMVMGTQHRLRRVRHAHKPGPCRDRERGKAMDIQSIIIWIIVGAIAGWLAGMVVKGGGFGLIGDIVAGVVGSVMWGWLLPPITFPLVGA